MVIYCFDGSMTGLLSCVFRAFQFQDFQATITSDVHAQNGLFDDFIQVSSNDEHAQRVWQGLKKKRLVRASVIFTTLFSQKIKVLISIYLTIVYMFFSTQIRLMKIMVSMMCWHWRSGPSKSGVKNIVWKHLFALKNAKMICF